MTVIVMKKDLATLFSEIVLVRMAGMVLMTAHSVSLESMFHYKVSFLAAHLNVLFDLQQNIKSTIFFNKAC